MAAFSVYIASECNGGLTTACANTTYPCLEIAVPNSCVNWTMGYETWEHTVSNIRKIYGGSGLGEGGTRLGCVAGRNLGVDGWCVPNPEP